MPHWMRYTLPGHERQYARMAVRVFGCDMDFENPGKTALEGVSRLQSFWKSLGLPLTLADINVPEGDIPALVQKTRCDDKGVLGAFKPLYKSDVEAILRACVEE